MGIYKAFLSFRELGARHQAIFCLRKVLSLDPTDKDALWDRSFLLKEDGKIDAAIRGFNELLSMTPHHVKVIDELAKLYRSKENMDKAIELYEQAMDYHFERDDMSDDDNDENKFRYTEINMLTELYIMVGEYEKALMCIKYGVMYLQRRIDDIDWQTGLDPADEDAEFDPNTDDPEAVDFASFPVELRARMAVCRIHLDYIDVAKVRRQTNRSFWRLIQ
jgi:general transcription factor 3C polypeptide 3 (transcription factor C subunit 4)